MPSPYADPFLPIGFHFAVGFGIAPGLLDTSFREVTGIAAEMDTEPVTEGGENRYVYQLPKAVKHPRLVLKRGVAPLTSPLVLWCKAVLEGGLGQSIETKQLRVALLDELRLPLRVWSFENAFPVKWEVEPFNSTKNEVAMEKVELSYLVSKREV